MAQNNVFGKEVKKRLIDLEWTMDALAVEVTKRTGLFCDNAYISRILSGQRNPPKIVQAIRDILSIPEPRSDNPDNKNAPQHSGAERKPS